MTRLILIVSSLLWVTMAPAGAKTLGERWSKNMREARAHLQAGDWRAGRNVAEKVVQSMTEQVTGGPDAAKTLAMALTLRAVGEAGTGDLDAAIWHWQVAQGLAPEAVTDELLTGFGTAGAALKAHPPRPIGKMLDGSAPHHTDADRVPPTLHGIEDFPMPRKLASTWRLHTVEVEILVDEQGKPAAPVIVRSSLPAQTYQLLEHARTRTFQPGTVAGQTVTSVASYTLSAA